MATFAVVYTYTDNPDGRDVHRPAHREYLEAQPELRAAAAFADEPGRALLIFAAEDLATIRDIVENDPFYLNGLISSYEVNEWQPKLGPAVDALS